MEMLREHHHYKKELIRPSDRVARYERYVIDLLLNSSLPDENSESSIAFELKHHSGTCQLGRILARKRGLPIDVCAVGMLLHDIYVILNGKYEDHAHLGAPIAKQIVTEIGGFNNSEIDQIAKIVYHHSEKDIYSDDPLIEFGKDADILDCFLYPDPFRDYLIHKPLELLNNYLARAKKVWHELGIIEDPAFQLLKNYKSPWFSPLFKADVPHSKEYLSFLLSLTEFEKGLKISPPAFCLTSNGSLITFYTNLDNWMDYVNYLRKMKSEEDLPVSQSVIHLLELPLTKNLKIDQIQKAILAAKSDFQFRPLQEDVNQCINNTIHQNCAILFWLLIDMYEILSNDRMSLRLEELGIKEIPDEEITK